MLRYNPVSTPALAEGASVRRKNIAYPSINPGHRSTTSRSETEAIGFDRISRAFRRSSIRSSRLLVGYTFIDPDAELFTWRSME
jgi:hypothetical protein